MRTLLAAAAVVAGLLTVPADAAPRVTPTVVTGAAGTMADVVFRTPVTFVDDGRSAEATASTGGWAGVVVVAAAGDPARRASLVSATLTEAFRCPGDTCAYSAGGPPLFGERNARGSVALPAGRYRVVLAGPAGSTVTAVLRPEGATGSATRLRTTARPVTYRAAAGVGVGAPGHEALLHSYEQIPASGVFGAAAMFASYAAAPAGGMLSLTCLTTGSENAITRQAGGTAPCADNQGFDFLYGPEGGALADRVGGAYAPVSVAAAAITGPSDESFGVGWDFAVAAPSSHLRSVFIGVTVS